MRENQEEKTEYQKYQEAGGIFNEVDYNEALERSFLILPPERNLNKQAELQAEQMAKFAGLNGPIDRSIRLYGILRTDTNPDKKEYHHSQMSDQSLFAEALRMNNSVLSLKKFIEAYHKTEINCPICLKVPVAGEGCRYP